MRINQQVWMDFQRFSGVRFVVKFCLAALLVVFFVTVTVGLQAGNAHAQSFASSPAQSAPASVTLSDNSAAPPVGHRNVFPYGQCTWWADQRYYEIHGVFVPWTTQSDAWQWTARAYQFGWHVSGSPSVGAIIDLQPWVQGAYGSGHVAVVEQVLSNGHVIASNMNWGGYPWQVTYVEFAPGPGVTFISW